MNVKDKQVLHYISSRGVECSVQGAGVGLIRGGWECDGWVVSFCRRGERPVSRMQFEYYCGVGHRYLTANPAIVKPKPPTAAAVLYSLFVDSEASSKSFQEWCDDLGYDSDSIKAFNTYRQCEAVSGKLQQLFTPEELGELRGMLADY